MATAFDNSPLVLIVRDGWGENPNRDHDEFNAVRLARTPCTEQIMEAWPSTLIRTCGEDVGLPAGTMGNSEVGHQNIGAGRIVPQELMRISGAIRDGSFAANPVRHAAFDHARENDRVVHLVGLASDGKVHSDLDHLIALIELAAQCDVAPDRLLIHGILDGRDTAPESALGFIERLEATFRVAGVGRIASVMGRYYAMDRDNRWDRTALAYACLTGRPVAEADLIEAGLQPRRSPSAAEAVRHQYRNPPGPSRRGDEFTIPTTIVPPEGEDGLRFVEDGDTIIFFNFRGDRPRQICKAFTLDDAAWGERERGGFDRGAKVRDLFFCTFTSYEEGLPVHIAFPRRAMMKNILGRVLADRGLTQFRCAETEKFAHVTFFFNDYQERPFDGERRMMVPSPTDVTTYDQKPEMSAAGVCESVVRRLARPDCEPIMIVNFANADMVGHTGVLAAAVRAVETVDAAVGRVIEAVLARNASAVITADHGNAEQMWDPLTESPHTAHTMYDVPLIVAGAAFAGATLRSGGRLGDIAPTMLEMAGLAAPPEMTGESLLG